MPPRSTPTARQTRLGTELRRMREHSGLGIQEAADLLGVGRSLITNIELAKFGVSEERVRTLAANYTYPDEPYVDALAAMARERKGGWWEEYRGSLAAGGLDLAELEHHARSLSTVQILHIPGLLQTEDYARAILSEAVPAWSSTELRRRLSHRLRRRDILDRADPPPCTFVIHEAALRTRFGNRSVLLTQLDHVLEASERTNITVRAIPLDTNGFPVAGVSLIYATGPVPQLDTVQLDAAYGSAFLDAETQLVNHRGILERTAKVALSPKDSRDFIRNIIHHT
ncbi:Scr1 family TA system antitoxin-like transcriptional regulator [Streptomyces sp. H10-C2]|uniref:Scr1 family TA system antitoxin-like transcriptional regulator n=1 Tax=unclassified Streptomyces TaxID=2593676 RepID=UPI0024B95FF8|nr:MULTISPECIES: Scr1 family TA system antitoxin-like transcriptional regulator [unclassified Streptomyces]MDJ0344628.1 Scr1 family TA system antitoxin-like transcriptional regulator [Streptomyces sp. PH10-H1]MDJ0373212.1 Scr1 family TA system antitoxin-like transcriptional regulator [Streptomyces sp. H10-C2]